MAQYPLDDMQASLYDAYAIDNEYAIHEGVLVLPVADEPPTDPEELRNWSPVQVVRAHAPFRVRTVNFDVRKKQTPPVLPQPADSGKFKFLGGTISMPAPTLTMNMSEFNWQASGQYVMVEDTVCRPEDGYVLGAAPYTLQSQKDNYDAIGGPPATVYREDGTEVVGGAIASAGPDPRVGQIQANQIDFTTQYWYNCPSFFPGVSAGNADMLNGGPVSPGG